MNKFLFLAMSSCWLFSCSSLSLYQPSDCEIPPDEYGRCYADLGYRPEAYEVMTKYCAKHGKKTDLEKFKAARDHRLKENCSSANKVFALEFRSAARVGGPETCPDALLTTKTLRRAAEDGRAAGNAFVASGEDAKNADEAEKRREVADDAGFWSGFWDRILPSADDYRNSSRTNREKSERLSQLYPDAPDLMARYKCNPSGLY